MNKYRKGNYRGNQGLRHMVLRKLGLEIGHVFLRAEVSHSHDNGSGGQVFSSIGGTRAIFFAFRYPVCSLVKDREINSPIHLKPSSVQLVAETGFCAKQLMRPEQGTKCPSCRPDRGEIWTENYLSDKKNMSTVSGKIVYRIYK